MGILEKGLLSCGRKTAEAVNVNFVTTLTNSPPANKAVETLREIYAFLIAMVWLLCGSNTKCVFPRDQAEHKDARAKTYLIKKK